MADAYETEAFEEILKHPTWEKEADSFEQGFTKGLYDDESVKKEGQAALVQVSNVLILYNRVDESKENAEGFYKGEMTELTEKLKKLDLQIAEIEHKEKKDPTDESQKKELEAIRDDVRKKIDAVEKQVNNMYSEGVQSRGIKDDEGEILSSLMLGGTGAGGNGYTLTDNSVQDTRKGAQYIREQMTEKGNLLDQMALLDNAMNTGGVDLNGGTTVSYETEEKTKEGIRKKTVNVHADFGTGENPKRKTLNDMFRGKNDMSLMITAARENVNDENGRGLLNMQAINNFQAMSEEQQNQIIGTEGAGKNSKSIMDAAMDRPLTEEAKKRKTDKKMPLPFSAQQDEDYEAEQKKKREEKIKKLKEEGRKDDLKRFLREEQTGIDVTNMSNRHRYMLYRAGLTEESALGSTLGMNEAQKRILRRIRYEQNVERQKKARPIDYSIRTSDQVNKNDKSENLDKIMTERDRNIAREVTGKGFLTTKDAEEVIHDPAAATGRLMNSSNAARNMMGMYRMLTADDKRLFRFRLALLAYLVPTRRNTVYEVLRQSQDAGIKGKENLEDPIQMYQTIDPLTREEIREKTPDKRFPHEKVFYNMLDEYRDLRDEVRMTPKAERKDLIENQREMPFQDLVRELLRPENGLALFAKLRLLTDESVTDEDIKKHMDRLTKEEQDAVNELFEKTGREATISYEELKAWLNEDLKKREENPKKREEKKQEFENLMREYNRTLNDPNFLDRGAGKRLEAKIREVESELSALEEEKKKLDGDVLLREARKQDYEERSDWMENRRAAGVKAVAKIRRELFDFLTATPTAFEDEAEARIAPLRKRLLVITRLANRFFKDQDREVLEKSGADVESLFDFYNFNKYEPNREEVINRGIADEEEGTLGMTDAHKAEWREQKRREEELERLRNEEEQRKKEEAERKKEEEIKDRRNRANRVKEIMEAEYKAKKIVPDWMEDKQHGDAIDVGRAVNRLINTHLSLDFGAIPSIPDDGFVEILPRILKGVSAFEQITALLEKRGDVNAALSEDALQRLRLIKPLLPKVRDYIMKKVSLYRTELYGKVTGEDFDKEMLDARVTEREEKAPGELTEEQITSFGALKAVEESGAALTAASEEKKTEDLPGAANGQSYLDNLTALKDRLEAAKSEEGAGQDAMYDSALTHLGNLITRLSETFDAGTDIGAAAQPIAECFFLLSAASAVYLNDADLESPQALLMSEVYEKSKGMGYKFTQAAYRTVELLSRANLFQRSPHLWARVMVIGAPLIKGTDEEGFVASVSSRPSLGAEGTESDHLDADAINEELKPLDQKKFKTMDDLNIEDRMASPSLARFRALLGSENKAALKKTVEDYEEMEARTYLEQIGADVNEGNYEKEELQKALAKKKGDQWEIVKLPKPEAPKAEPPQQEPPQQKPPQQEGEKQEEDKPLTKEDIARILEEQDISNAAAKEGEEDRILEQWRKYREELDKYKSKKGKKDKDKMNDRDKTIVAIQQQMQRFIDNASAPLPKLILDKDGNPQNMQEIQEAYGEQMKEIHYASDHVFRDSHNEASAKRDHETDPYMLLCFRIYKLAFVSANVCNQLRKQKVSNALNVSTDGVKPQNRLDIKSYAWRQIKAGKLRPMYFLQVGSMILKKGGYEKPEKWQTQKDLLLAEKEKRKKRPVVENQEGEGEIHLTEQEQQDLENELQNEGPILPNNGPEGENENPEQKQEKQEEKKDEEQLIDEQMKNLENNLEEGDYEDEQGEIELTDEEEKAAKAVARQRAKEEAARLKAERDKKWAEITPTMPTLRKKRKKAIDDFSFNGPALDDLTLEEPEQQAAGKRTFASPLKKDLRKRDKVAKVSGWALFGPIWLLSQPFKYLGNGMVTGVNAALRWAKKKTGGMQKTAKNASAETQERIKREIRDVRSGDSNQEVITDRSRVPMNWAEELADNPDAGADVTVGVPAAGSAKGDFSHGEHVWLRLRYSKRDPVFGRKTRYKVDVGFGPRGGFSHGGDLPNALKSGAAQATHGAVVPGELWNESANSYAAAKTYPVTNRQINQMLLEAERYPAGGYNLMTRNCTTFAAEVTEKAGVNTKDLFYKNPLRLGGALVATPLVSIFTPVTKMISGTAYLGKTGNEDLSFARYGEKQLTEDELKRMQENQGMTLDTYLPTDTMNAAFADQKKNRSEINALSDEFEEDDRDEVLKKVQGKIDRTATDIQQVLHDDDVSAELSQFAGAALAEYAVDSEMFEKLTSDMILSQKSLFKEQVKQVSDFYYNRCNADDRLRDSFVDLIGHLNRLGTEYDKAFREARLREQEEFVKDSDVSAQIKSLSGRKNREYLLHTGNKQETAVFSGPAQMIGHAKRGKSIQDVAALRDKNKNKGNLLDALDRGLAAENESIWQKEAFSGEEVELAFSTMQEQQENIIHRKDDLQEDYDFTGAEVMQALIFERIYGGIKERMKVGGWFKKPEDEQGEATEQIYRSRADRFMSWLKQDLALSRRSHSAEVLKIRAAIGKHLQLNMEAPSYDDETKIAREYNTRLYESYLKHILAQAVYRSYGENQYAPVYSLIMDLVANRDEML